MKVFKLLFFSGLLLFYCNVLFASKAKFASIEGKLDFLKEGDTVCINVYKLGSFQNYQQWKISYYASVHNHHFSVKLPLANYPHYVDVEFSKRSNKSLFFYLLSSGDQISISMANNTLAFKGNGAASWNIQYQFSIINRQYHRKYFDTRKILEDFMTVDSATKAKFNYLKSCKNSIAQDKYYLLNADLIGENEMAKYSHLSSDYQSYKDSILKLSTAIINYRKSKSLSNNYLPNDIVNNSNAYCKGVIDKYKIDSCILTDRPFLVGKAYWFLKKEFHDKLKQQLITYLLFSNRYSTEDLSDEIIDALKWVHDRNYREVLSWLRDTMIKGALAPEFTLTDANGQKFSLSDYKGKVVLLDFWFTGCGSCRALYPILKSVEEKFDSKDVVFVSISIDRDKGQWLNSIQGEKYTSQKSSNLYTEGKGLDHQVIKQYNINAFPTLILIDKLGKLCSNPISPLEDNGQSLISLLKNAEK